MADGAAAMALDARAEARLVELARRAVLHAAREHAILPVALHEEPPALQQPGATFVTLRTPGLPEPLSLRGCIGSVEASRALALDVVANAAGAARRDPRFAPVTPEEASELEVAVSVLSPFERMPVSSEQDLIARLRPGVDGLLLHDRGRRALYLPQVWEQLPDPRAFVKSLTHKAGLAQLSPDLQAERFTVRHLK